MDALTLLLLILSVLSHVGMSIFFAKPRYNKLVTSLIWLVYAVVFLILPPTTPKLNYTLMVLLNAVLFFIATKGKPIEKGFFVYQLRQHLYCFRCVCCLFSGKGNAHCRQNRIYGFDYGAFAGADLCSYSSEI